ncbi:SPFH domain-containing protein [Streptacidiphilus fuscans]|uniref:SPFH domain-containing protein n=1 Tax=Streptacidiphilus fuscans TaxID=2789292 RepID=A0A931B594_9ACTN|nr:SPFH domain-containing protein [Streptacidiphilus fuscans]MBF9069652.1 SPFH domain-containing protein [Streptacidiphilus fuscans]
MDAAGRGTTGGNAPVGGAPVGVVEREAASLPGGIGLVVGLALIAGGIALVSSAGNGSHAPGAVVLVLGVLALAGLTAVAPGQARVVTLFGRYLGTVRTNGLRWLNPFTKRQRVSTRIRNHETETLKVNDADGNPIEMAAVVVWQIADTAQAAFGVDDVVDFVSIQTDTAVRHIAGSFPYDARGEARLSLRENAEEITSRLSAEIADRVERAGVVVLESRITRLSYAPEIAQAMLRRQQADAIVAARQRLVEGAVGMVRSALDQLAEEEVVELDEERKAVMVSNLLVVLCSDHATQPVVNTGTLYQ